MTLTDMAEMAARYDTTMSWAMLRALLARGVSVRLPSRRRHQYDHMLRCFANHGSPMDGLRQQ